MKYFVRLICIIEKICNFIGCKQSLQGFATHNLVIILFMKYQLQRNVLLLAVMIMLAFSFGWGAHNYSLTRSKIKVSLNVALQQTMSRHAAKWLTADTLKAYTQIQAAMGNPVSVRAFDKTFAAALPFAPLRSSSGIQVRLLPRNVRPSTDELSGDCLMSDTILWMSPAVQTASAVTPILVLRGYAHCPFWKVFLLSHPDGPIIVFCLSLLIGSLMPLLLYRRRRKIQMSAGVISVGNMSLSTIDSCFYDEQHNRIRLTPLQYSLMEMFFLSSSHYLCKAEICQSLWPGKDNADETLYTLVRRLKPIIEANSNLYIKTDRGRAYRLEKQY